MVLSQFLAAKKLLNIPSLEYAWVGRWSLYMEQRQFTHTNIIQSTPLSGEKALGWFMHYTIMIAVAFPFFIMQPAFGFGIAVNKTPASEIARFRSFLAHPYFGIRLSLAWYIIL